MWSRTTVDQFFVYGRPDLVNLVVIPGNPIPGNVSVAPINSALGRASLRVGTSLVYDSVAIQPFVTASVFHEFAGNVSTTFRSCAEALQVVACGTQFVPLVGDISTARIKT
ncbi:MAG: autotransporter domain-containing protein, partial [Rhizobiales bacterium]|nr:autotransporter domain-containing protein [Hyphomicrobiales bacterium]